MSRGSLRLRLLLAGAISILAALTLSGLGLTLLFERHVERRVEAELSVTLDQIVAGIDRGMDGALIMSKTPADPRFADNPARVRHQGELYAMLDAIMLTADTAHWASRLEAAGIPCSPVQSIAQMVAHEQTAALGLVQDVPDTAMRFLGLPLAIDGARPRPSARPPALGEHDHILFGNREA